MALIIHGSTTCPLCGKFIAEGEFLVVASRFIRSQDDPLWRYSDAAMHRHCFLGWELRFEFVARYNSTVGAITFGNGTCHYMQDDGTVRSLVRNPPPST